MKRMWIGVILLAAVLAASLWSGGRMERVHMQTARHLTQAEEAAARGQWTDVRSFTAWAESIWRKEQLFTAAFAEHEHMDNIEGLFAQLRTYAGAEDALSFRVICACLVSQLEALSESHSFSPGNIL